MDSPKAPEKPNFSQMVEQNLLTMKKRTSQIKGELMDGLTEIIAKNFEQTFQLASQLVAQIDLREKKLEDLEKKLEEVYSAHPELKITAEAEAKELAAKAKKGMVKKV